MEKNENPPKPREKEKTNYANVSFRMILKYSDWRDKLFIAIATLASIGDGSSLALNMLLVSRMMNGFAISSLTSEDVDKYILSLLYVAIGVGSAAFLQGFFWTRIGERQASRLRSKYLRAVLRQDVGFFDASVGASRTSQVVSCISTDSLTIQEVFSEKMPNFITNVAIFILSQITAFYLCWRLAIVAMPTLLFLIIPGRIYKNILTKLGKKMYIASATANGIAEQAFSSIGTVYSYAGENQIIKKYSAALEPTRKFGIQLGLMKGVTIGSIGIVYAIWALQGWYGSVLIAQHKLKGGDLYFTGVCIVFGGLALVGALSNLRYFTDAKIAATHIFEMIDRIPDIDSAENEGQIIEQIKGEVEFKNINFAYPSRQDTLILRNFNLKVMPSQTVGLVGSSGSGKSTVINLLERFYDPLGGEILLDGINIGDLNLKWLRGTMALVDQAPILFATTIRENILFGKEDATEEEIIRATRAANAHDFISDLPDGYGTQVGQLGTQLSGGQKQRISIARALIRDPKILLLDEATSSLDSQSEKIVQDALSQATLGRTTIIIAHRLTTLRNADFIGVIHLGQVVESGPHDQLIKNIDGPYSRMVNMQTSIMNDEVTGDNNTSSAIFVHDNKILEKNDTITQDLETKTKINYEEHEVNMSLFRYLIQISSSEFNAIGIASSATIFNASIQPLNAMSLGAIASIYFIGDTEEMKRKAVIYSMVFLSFAVCAMIFSVIQHYYFARVGENLTTKVRESIFKKTLTFEIEWFDQESNSSGALCSRLSKDAAMVRTLMADRLSLLVQTTSAVILAVVLSMFLSWKLAIVAVSVQPAMVMGYYMQATMMKRMSEKILKSQNKSSMLASESVANHRTITAYFAQEKILTLFRSTQVGPRNESKKQSWYAGLALFTASFLTNASACLLYWYGGKLLSGKKVTFGQLFQVQFIMMSTGKAIADAGSATSDISKGFNAFRSVLRVLEKKSKIDPNEPNGIEPKTIKGDIELKGVEFFYPARPGVSILKDVNLKVDAGQVVALVGQSGSGKSTIIKIIERFYDPCKGSVEIDGINIRCYNLRALRLHVGLVSQDPALFSGTIHENIAYGKEQATEDEIVEAAKLANAHEFISSMEDGYSTRCGERGLQLSGGQKQRIAIARAILKNPSILLLDEATSALDVITENLVQEAIEKTMINRTCLVVAHRLVTIRKANRITVVEHGRIIEEGTHHELVAKGENGNYFKFVQLQQHDGMK